MKILSLIQTLSTIIAIAASQIVFEPPLIQSVEAVEDTEASDELLNFDSTDVEVVIYEDSYTNRTVE